MTDPRPIDIPLPPMEGERMFDLGLRVAQLDPEVCRCVQQWPGHPCGYCHERVTV